MSNKLKEIFCYTDSPIGRFSEWVMKLGISAEIDVDVSEVDNFKTYCWCCALWRGVALGGIAGLIVGAIW